MQKEDLRVVRTKKMLTNALKELLQEKSFDKITVNDICDRALVHRATFYNHFNDKIDLLNFIFDDMQEEIYNKTLKIGASITAKQMYVEIIERILDYCEANRESLKLILKNSTNEFRTILIENIKNGIVYLLSKNKEIGQSNANIEAVESFYTGGLSALCIELVLSDKKIDKSVVLSYLESVMETTLNVCR